MQAPIRRMGNSSGVILPKPLLSQLGVQTGDILDLTLEDGRLVLVPAATHVRDGWEAAAKDLAAHDDDGPVWPEFGNLDDANLEW